MARTKPDSAEELDPELLGAEGEICSQCGTKLAVDQRYCLNCGTPRAEPRLDYERALAGGGATGAGAPGQPQGQQAVQWTPLAAVAAIAILGGMLLLGVLIGQDDNSVTVTEVQQSEAGETTSATTETTTTTPEATTTAPPETTTETLPQEGSGFGRGLKDEAGGVGAAP